MWPFKKKHLGADSFELPSLKLKDDITLLPENHAPNELPPLEIKSKSIVLPEMPEKEIEMREKRKESHGEVKAAQIIVESSKTPKQIILESMEFPEFASEMPLMAKIGHVFVESSKCSKISSEISDANNDFDSIEVTASKIIELKEEKDGKAGKMQESLDEISKKLILMEKSLFGG